MKPSLHSTTARKKPRGLTAKFLSEPDSLIRAQILDEALKRAGPRPIALVRLALRDKVPFVRKVAIRGVGKLCIRALGPDICQMLANDRDDLVRTGCAEALCGLQSHACIRALRSALADRYWMTRGCAARSLALLEGEKARRPIEAALAIERRHWVRVCYMTELIRLGDSALLPKLVKELVWRNFKARANAARSLGRLADQHNAALIHAALAKQLRVEWTVVGTLSLCTALIKLLPLDGSVLDTLIEAHARIPDDSTIAWYLCRAYVLTGQRSKATETVTGYIDTYPAADTVFLRAYAKNRRAEVVK